MTITYTTAVDLNDDGDYVDASEALSTDVVMLHWRLGMAAPYDSLGAPSQAQITLRNTTQKYSPETVAALALLPGKRLRITSFDGTITRTHFTGIIERVEPLAGTLGKRSAVIHAVGPEKQITSAEVRLAPQQCALGCGRQRCAGCCPAAPRHPQRRCAVLDVVGYAELGTNTTLADAYPNTLDVGKSTFTYVGDTWAGGIAADDALRQLVESERGRFLLIGRATRCSSTATIRCLPQPHQPPSTTAPMSWNTLTAAI
ncbi:MAG: hypothetical protein U0694_06790 [Anaerolineae bacterium]